MPPTCFQIVFFWGGGIRIRMTKYIKLFPSLNIEERDMCICGTYEERYRKKDKPNRTKYKQPVNLDKGYL